MSDGHRSGRSTGRVSCKCTELKRCIIITMKCREVRKKLQEYLTTEKNKTDDNLTQDKNRSQTVRGQTSRWRAVCWSVVWRRWAMATWTARAKRIIPNNRLYTLSHLSPYKIEGTQYVLIKCSVAMSFTAPPTPRPRLGYQSSRRQINGADEASQFRRNDAHNSRRLSSLPTQFARRRCARSACGNNLNFPRRTITA